MRPFVNVGGTGLLLAAWLVVAQAASVVAATPQGEVAQVRQVTIEFSEAMVPIGDPRLPDPFVRACQGTVPAGTDRWANDRTWLYDFGAALGPGVRCTVKLRSDWKPSSATASTHKPAATGSTAPATATLTGPTVFSFSTGGPAVLSVQPNHGNQIEEDQHFLMRLSGPAVEASVLANA